MPGGRRPRKTAATTRKTTRGARRPGPLEDRLSEALEQQTATSEILRLISRSPADALPVFDAIVQHAARLCDAEFSAVARLVDGQLHLVALNNLSPEEAAVFHGLFPRPPRRGFAMGRAVVDGRPVHIPDVLADAAYDRRAQGDLLRVTGYRTILGVPILQRGAPVGVILCARRAVRPFTPSEIALVETFADQAVIAIENARLVNELGARNRALTESLEQQTATSDILRVISSSQTDVQPVFDTIARSAAQLCEAEFCFVFRFDGQLLHLVAHHGLSEEGLEALTRAWPLPPSRGSVAGRAILARGVAQIPDVHADAEYVMGAVAAAATFRSTAAVPLMRDGLPIGVITVLRPRPGLFPVSQVALLQTFADQAVIAVENVRLFTELGTRNRDLTETLEQQTATGEILSVISSSPTDVRPVFDTIASNARRLCQADSGSVFTYDGTLIRLESLDNTSPEGSEALRRAYPMEPTPATAGGRALLTAAPVHIPDVRQDPGYVLPGVRDAGLRSVLAVPMLREGIPVGVIIVHTWDTPRPFTGKQIALLKIFAAQAVIAIQNVRLFTELETRNRELTETLEQQTATGEILRVISSSPTDVQPVFDSIAQSAARLCEGTVCQVFRFDGQLLHFVAGHGHTTEMKEATRRAFSTPPNRGSAAGRSVLDTAIAQIPDVDADPDFALGPLARLITFRSIVAVPMIRDGRPIGAIAVGKDQVGLFSDRQVELLKTFADQAVIAIENVRLFTELEGRNRELTDTLEQQTATGDILRVISSSPTDVGPVFDIIAERAVRLCDADVGVVSRVDGAQLQLAAIHGVTREGVEAVQRVFPLRLDFDNVTTRVYRDRAVVHVADVMTDATYAMKSAARTGGWRAGLGAPMLRDGQVIGVIFVGRSTPGLFSDQRVELLKTFADQAVIAVENVRLFTELESRNRDLTVTLEQQTATGEILRVISSSPTDVQPVFDAIVESAVRLCEAFAGALLRFDGEMLHQGSVRGPGREQILQAWTNFFPYRPGPEVAIGQAVLERRVIHIEDVAALPSNPLREATRRAGGYRAFLAVPMLRDDAVVGVIACWRAGARAFDERQISLVQTFADQAVIAIENVRLFTELEARTAQLTRSVSELQALGEVSHAVSSTLDLETVLATIVSRAVQLSGGSGGIVYEFDEATQTFHARVTHQIPSEFLAAVRAAPIRLGEGSVGRAGVERAPVEIADLEAEPRLVAPQVRGFLTREGLRSLLAVPLIREDQLLGGLVVVRRERGGFAPEVVATLQTFAAQSGLAIHNARLFREVHRQKQYSDTLVETSPVAIVTMDLQGTVAGWNPGAERLFGYAAAEALGRRMEDLVATEGAREEVRANVRQTLDGEWIRAIGRRARKDGTVVDVEISSVPVAVDGVRMGMIAIYHDITELLQARRDAETANEAKSAFLATMSHEIRTPMNAVIGMSGLLLNTALSGEQREYAEVVRQSSDALLTVINDILDFSKIEAGRLELESQPFDLRECVEGALDLVASRAAEKGLDLAYLLGEGVPPAVLGDVTRLRQILLNLLSNAVKFTEAGEVVLSVTAHRPVDAPASHELTFSVRDTGIGIPPDRAGRLFQSFSQVDASTTRRYGGTGLGLAISQRLTELMGGRITVTSEVGVGSEFRFTIRATAAQAPLPARRDWTGVQPSLRGKRVLVVDDNATNRRILSSYLGTWGMPAQETGSPAEALAWIRTGERFDVAILDMHMPEMDGAALAAAMRQHPAGTTLPLVLFTSLGRREALADSDVFAAYLHKPIKPSQLFDALVSVLAEQPVHVAPRASTRGELDPEMARRHPLRILLAEDNVVNQKLALRLLAQMGYRADLAANGLEAIEAVARQTYDVILMDVQMPELDGLEASREINRRWPAPGRPRIVAMTANAMQGDRELCEAAGMDDYVAKPIRVEELVAALDRAAPRREAGALAPPEAGRAAIDRATIDQLSASMGAAFVAELIDTFGEDARELIATLRRALSAADLDAFRRAAHSLKSTGESLGATGLAALARDLEASARAGRLEGAEHRVRQLEDQYDLAIRTLGAIRRDLIA